MDRQQARGLVAALQAYFPVPELPGSTVELWAHELEPFDLRIGAQMVAYLGRSRTKAGPFQIGELVTLCESEQRMWNARHTPRLPAWTDEDEAEARDVAARLLRSWLDEHDVDGTPRTVTTIRRPTETEADIERRRELARQIAAEERGEA